jgi:alpha-glucosidase
VLDEPLDLNKQLLKIRKSNDMGNGEFRWAPEFMNETTLAYINNGILVLANFSGDPVVIPAGEILVTTQHDLRLEGELEHDQVVWIKL